MGYILAAFGLVAGLAWNDAIQSLIKQVFPFATGSLLAKFAYAIIITVIVIGVTMQLRRVVTPKK